MPKHPWIEFPLCFLAVVGPVVMILCRCLIKKEIRHTDGSIEKRPWGIGVRMIQLVAILILGPVVAVLGLEGTLSGEGPYPSWVPLWAMRSAGSPRQYRRTIRGFDRGGRVGTGRQGEEARPLGLNFRMRLANHPWAVGGGLLLLAAFAIVPTAVEQYRKAAEHRQRQQAEEAAKRKQEAVKAKLERDEEEVSRVCAEKGYGDDCYRPLAEQGNSDAQSLLGHNLIWDEGDLTSAIP